MMGVKSMVDVQDVTALSADEVATPPPPADTRTIRRRVFDLAGPVIGENFLETLLGIIDTLLVAGLGAVAIAGIGNALQVMFFLISALSALAIGSSVLVAQAFGAGDMGKASELARQSILWSLICSVPLSILGWMFAGSIISVFGVEPEVATISTQYLEVTLATVIVLVALFIGGGVLRGVGDGRTPMVVTAIANAINVALAYGLIYGHWGLPNLGPVGSAWATFIARAIALVLLLAVLWRGRNGITIRGGSWRPQFGVARQVLNIGVPAAMEQVLISGAFFALTVLVARLGTDTLAAYRISFTALSFSFLPGIGFAIAATALVGQSIGAKRLEEGGQAARVATWWGVIWMSAIGLIFLVFAEPIMRQFSDQADVVQAGAAGLRVVALAQPFWAILFVQEGALRGTGNTRYPLVVGGGSIWLSVLIAFVLLNTVGGALMSIWVAFLITSPIVAVLMWRRFARTLREYKG